MAKTPDFIESFIPYTRLVKKKSMWRSIAGSHMVHAKYLIANTYGVDPDKVHDLFFKAWDKSDKDYPTAVVTTPQNSREAEKYNKYVLFLWEYYVKAKKKKKDPPKEAPPLPKENPPKVEDSYDEQEVDPDNPYAADDEPSMIQEMSNLPKQEKLYDGVSENDLVTEDIDERVLRLIGLDDAVGIDYGTYFTLLDEALVSKKGELSDVEAAMLANEKKSVRNKIGRFRIKKTTIERSGSDAFKPKSTLVPNIVKNTPSALPPRYGPDPAPPKKKVGLEANVSAIRKTVEAILDLMQNRFKNLRDQDARDRRTRENVKRSNREGNLEKGIAKAAGQARKMLAPAFDMLDKIINYITNVLLGRALVKLVDWLSDPENKKKVDTILRFIKDWWPAILAAYIAFATPLGKLIRFVVGSLSKFIFTIAKKGIPMLARFIAKNPLKSAAVLIPTLAAMGAIQQANTPAADPKEAAEGKTQLNDTLEMGGATGDPMSVLGTFNGGGRVPSMPTFKRGGKVERPKNGSVKATSGQKISGAGVDTQLIAAQPGEIVISKKAVDKYGAPFFLNLNKLGGGTNKPNFKRFDDIQLAQGGGVVGGPTIDMEKVMQTLRDAYITPDDLGPAGPDNPRIQNVANYLYGMEKLNTEGLDEFQIEDLQIAKKSYPKMDKKKKRGSTSFLSKPRTEDTKEKKPKAKPRPMGRSAAKLRKEKEGGDEKTAVSEEGQKSVKPSTQNNAPFAGSITPVKGLGEAKKSAPTAVIGQSKPNVDAPPPPQPTTNLISMSANGDQKPTSSATSAGGSREIDTAFSTSLATETRLMMMAIYGISEVE